MKQLDPKAVWLFFIQSMHAPMGPIFFLFAYLIYGMYGYFSKLDSGGGLETVGIELSLKFLSVVIVLAIPMFIWAKLTYKFYRYELREDGFRKEYGVIQKKYVTIPYDRIQNIDIYRGIADRLLGLSDLQIQTAGANIALRGRRYGSETSAEGRLPGLSQEVAEELRDELIRRARYEKTTNQGL